MTDSAQPAADACFAPAPPKSFFARELTFRAALGMEPAVRRLTRRGSNTPRKTTTSASAHDTWSTEDAMKRLGRLAMALSVAGLILATMPSVQAGQSVGRVPRQVSGASSLPQVVYVLGVLQSFAGSRLASITTRIAR